MLLEKTNFVDDHATVNGFAHVVDREKRSLNGMQSLHLNTGYAMAFDGGKTSDFS